MTFNLFFITISIVKRDVTLEEVQNQQRVENMYQEMKDRQYTTYRQY